MSTRFKNNLVLALFSGTLFLSAGLMFSFQPMIGKMLLPIVGGSPSGWMVALAFFQTALLAGYYLAHLLSRLAPRRQALVQVLLMCAGAAFQPVALAASAGFVGPMPGPLDTLLLLAKTIAVPFIVLSAMSSTLQRLFTATGHPSAGNPYFLFAASNLGSFAGLFLYPLVIEPALRVSTQSGLWMCGYAALILFVLLCTTQAGKPAAAPAQGKAAPPPWKQRARWMVLAFVPSSLLMGLTFFTTTDIVSMPLLWVIPLAVYLLTFVLAFARRQIVSLDWLERTLPVAVVLAIASVFIGMPANVGTSGAFALGAFVLHVVVFGIVALLCHIQLARSRPSDGGENNLTLFYLSLAAGGAIGGILNAFVAPLIFDSAAEYPLMLIASCAFAPSFRPRRRDIVFLALAAAAVAVTRLAPEAASDAVDAVMIAAPALAVAALLALAPRVTMAVCAIIVFASVQSVSRNSIFEGRNFYGVLRVYNATDDLGGGPMTARWLVNGTTIHGKQIVGHETEPTLYYTHDGPLGDIFETFQPRQIAAVGLGAGTVACYGTRENEITFFEINPLVVDIAKKNFSFLSGCGTGKEPSIVLGDARLKLQEMKDARYDLIILDAFASDAVPTHLMTKEAIAMYFDRLSPHGVVAFHISNRHFLLGTPLIANANALGFANRYVVHFPRTNPYATDSIWLVMARSEETLGKLTRLPWKNYGPEITAKVWTDDYDDLVSIMHIN